MILTLFLALTVLAIAIFLIVWGVSRPDHDQLDNDFRKISLCLGIFLLLLIIATMADVYLGALPHWYRQY